MAYKPRIATEQGRGKGRLYTVPVPLPRGTAVVELTVHGDRVEALATWTVKEKCIRVALKALQYFEVGGHEDIVARLVV